MVPTGAVGGSGGEVVDVVVVVVAAGGAAVVAVVGPLVDVVAGVVTGSSVGSGSETEAVQAVRRSARARSE